MENEHTQAFRVSTDGLSKQAAFAIGRPRGDVDKMRTGELPTPLQQAERLILRMLDEGQPERAALCEFRQTASNLGLELVPKDDWTPTTRQIANRYGATAETKRVLEEALTKLFEVGEPFEKSPNYKRGRGARRQERS